MTADTRKKPINFGFALVLSWMTLSPTAFAEPMLRVPTGMLSPLILGSEPEEPTLALTIVKQPSNVSVRFGDPSASTGVELQGAVGAIAYAFEPGSEVPGVFLNELDGTLTAGASASAGTHQTRLRATDIESGGSVTSDLFQVTVAAPAVYRVALSSGAHVAVTGWTGIPANLTRYGASPYGVYLYTAAACGGFFLQLDSYGSSFGGASACKVNGSFAPRWEQITGQSAVPKVVDHKFLGTAGVAYTASWSHY